MALAGICRTTQVLRFFKFSRCSVNFLTETKQKHVQYLFLVDSAHCKYFCTERKPRTPGKPGDPKPDEKPKKKKALTSPQITLIASVDDVHAMTLEQAEKLSKRRNLKLVKIVDYDTKTERPVYKLMTTLEFFQESSEAKEKKKKEKNASVKEAKLFTLSAKIGDHDLESKVRHMFKLLKKRHEVKVLIAFDGNPTRAEEVKKLIEEELTEVSSSRDSTAKSNTFRLRLMPKSENEITATESKTKTSEKVEEPNKNESKETATDVKE